MFIEGKRGQGFAVKGMSSDVKAKPKSAVAEVFANSANRG